MLKNAEIDFPGFRYEHGDYDNPQYARGQYDKNIRAILISENFDLSTPFHETAHPFFSQLISFYKTGKLKGRALQDFETFVRHYAGKNIDILEALSDKTTLYELQEHFATDFERYLHTGKAPSRKLRHLFECFKRWLRRVYDTLLKIPYVDSKGEEHYYKLDPKIRKMFDPIFLSIEDLADDFNRKTAEERLTSELGTKQQRDADLRRTFGDFSNIGEGVKNFFTRINEAYENSLERDPHGLYLNQRVNRSRDSSGSDVYIGKQNSIQDVLNIMQTEDGMKNAGRVWCDYARVSEDEAKRISKATGFDISDKYIHTFPGSAVVHTLNRHKLGKEQREDQLPIPDTDFRRIPDII